MTVILTAVIIPRQLPTPANYRSTLEFSSHFKHFFIHFVHHFFAMCTTLCTLIKFEEHRIKFKWEYGVLLLLKIGSILCCSRLLISFSLLSLLLFYCSYYLSNTRHTKTLTIRAFALPSLNWLLLCYATLPRIPWTISHPPRHILCICYWTLGSL